MTDSLTEAKKMQEMFLKYFHSTLSINLIILIIYVLFVCVAILKYSLKGIIASVIGITLAYTAYLLVYDVTYIQYLMSLRLDEGFRLLVAQYLPLFSLSKHAPSKALPRIDLKQANILKMKFNVSFIMNAYYEYNRMLREHLMVYGRALGIIITMETTKQVLKSKNTKVLNKSVLFKELVKH